MTQVSAPTLDHDTFRADEHAEVFRLFDGRETPTWDLIARANRIRESGFGRQVHLCAILNAKSGACSEDCSFCSQSAHHTSEVPVYPLVAKEEALEAARAAESAGARCFGLVTSGHSISNRQERRAILDIVETVRNETRIQIGASLGIANAPFLRDLKSAGLDTFHHNLETARSYYANVCDSHPFEERLRTVHAVRETGLRLCSGGIFGLGESIRQRAELAILLKELAVERIPVNFLNPIPGTRLERQPKLRPLEALHTLAALRVLLPEPDILMCGGREAVLGSLQSLLFMAGANGMMTGNYLTTAGQGVSADQRLLDDLELEWKKEHTQSCQAPHPA